MRKIVSFFSMLMLVTVLAFAQTRPITGRVVDEAGQPVSGASVIIKGSTVGASADANGAFRINAKTGDVLVVSAVGTPTQEIKVGSASNLTVRLTRQNENLTEVVVTALQTRRNKNEVVYSTQTVRNEALNEVVNRSAINALQGKVSGVKIVQASGAPGASTRVVLRGETSLTGGNNALIVVDGVPLNNSSASGGGGTGKLGDRDNYVDFGNRANDINPDDVESMSVLKGPAATSLYGSRGAAGVILITTKKGRKSGAPRVSVGTSLSTDRAYLVMKQQDKFGSGYKTCNGCGGGPDIFMGENFSWGAELDGHMIPWTAVPADENDNLLPLSNGKIEQLSRPYSYVENHLQNFFDNGLTNRNNISIDGGSDKFTYFMSYTNFNNKGIVPHSSYNKNNFLFNGSANFSEKLSSTFSLNYSKIGQRGVTEGGYPFGYSSGTPAYSFALQTPVNIPFSEMRDYNSPYQDFKGFYAQYSINPYFILDQQEVRNSVDNVIANVTLNYNLFKNFLLTGRASTNFNISSVTEKNPQFRYFRALSYLDGELSDFNSPRENFSLGSYKESLARRTDLNFDVLGTYTKQIGTDYKVTATGGFNSIQQQVRVVAGSTSGGLVIPGFYDLSNSKARATGDVASSTYRLMGAYLNTNLGYKNMLFLEYSARNDWSSTLPEGHRGFFYQAGGFSFVPTNYFNIKNDVLNFLKVRGNIGTTGKDAPLYRLNNTFTLNPAVLNLYGDDYQIALPFNGQAGSQRSNTIGNPNLKPELTITYEGGVDVGLLKDRLTVEYTYYYSNSKNQIVDVNLPWSSGFNIFPLNVGRMVNSGHELAVRGTPIRTKTVDLRLFLTFAKNSNQVKSVAEEYGLKELTIYTGLVHFSGHGTMNMVAAEGLPFGTYKGTDFVYDPAGNVVVDASGNPKQSSDQKYLGSYQPDFITSFGTDLTVKGVSLHVLFDARKGGKFFSGTKMSTEYNGTALTTLMENRQPFVIPGSVVDDNGTFKANAKPTNAYQYLAKTLPASGYLLDASYLKLREVSLSYTLTPKLLNRTPFSGITLNLFAKNLKYWLPKENTFADPEVGGVGGASDAVGIETSTTPTARSLGFDLRFNLK